MAKIKKEESAPAGAPAWMATYGDLVTNLLCFFVLLFSFSSIDQAKFQQLIMSFEGSPSVFEDSLGVLPENMSFRGLPEMIDSEMLQDGEMNELRQDMEEFEKAVEEYQKEFGVNLDLEYVSDGRGIKITFPDKILFNPGFANIKPEAHHSLDFVASILQEGHFKERKVRVEGHADNLQISSQRYSSNWELSTARAVNVLRYFAEEKSISPERLMATGYGEYRPVAPNDTPEGRALNRRVDIIVLSEEEVLKEPN